MTCITGVLCLTIPVKALPHDAYSTQMMLTVPQIMMLASPQIMLTAHTTDIVEKLV